MIREDTVRKAAQASIDKGVRLQISYGGKTREIEPYSVRERVHRRVLYAVEFDEIGFPSGCSQLKSFALDRFVSAKLLSVPRGEAAYPIERVWGED